MSILIKGIEMPEHGMVINIYPDGRVADHFDEFCETIATAVPIPPHGRLGDLDRLEAQWANCDHGAYYDKTNFVRSIQKAPTIIPAEEEKNTNTWPEYRSRVLGTQK